MAIYIHFAFQRTKIALLPLSAPTSPSTSITGHLLYLKPHILGPYVIENLPSVAPPSAQDFFYRTSGGAEIDLLLTVENNKTWAIEIKSSHTPKVTKGFHAACADLNPDRTYVVYGGIETYPMSLGVTAIGLSSLMQEIQSAS